MFYIGFDLTTKSVMENNRFVNISNKKFAHIIALCHSDVASVDLEFEMNNNYYEKNELA